METDRVRKEKEQELINGLIPLERPPYVTFAGVLLSDKIIQLCKDTPPQSKMIQPFDERQLHPAGYKLTVGDEFAINGEVFRLSDGGQPRTRPYIKLEPFQVAIIRTAEILCIPRFMIARWNIVVKSAYQGLLWVGAAQVDPGWRGRLSCPIYNLSSKPVILRAGEDLALMDFVHTTTVPENYLRKVTPTKWERYPTPDSVVLQDYNVSLESALFTHAGQKIHEFEVSQSSLETRMNLFTTVVITALATVPAFLASIGLNQSGLTVSIWGPIAVFFSVFALIWVVAQPRSLFGRAFAPVRRKGTPPKWIGFALVATAVIAGSGAVWSSYYYSALAAERLLASIRAAGIERVAEIIRYGGPTAAESRLVFLEEFSEFRNLSRDVAALEERVQALQGLLSEPPKIAPENMESNMPNELENLSSRIDALETLLNRRMSSPSSD